jgi:large subunit ribosomal protein L15e
MVSISRLKSTTWKTMIGKGNAVYLNAYRARLVEWRRQNTVVRLDKPTRIERARALGYRDNHCTVVVRVRVRKGHPLKSRPKAGRRPKRMGIKKLTYLLSDKRIAEQRVYKRYRNMRVLGSYMVGEDGEQKWFEVVLARKLH